MNGLSIICTLTGIVAIAARGPLIFAPTATRAYYRKLLGKNVNIRILGLAFLLLSVGMILTSRDHPHDAAVILTVLGYGLALFSVVFLLIFVDLFKLIANAFLDAMDNVMLRGMGVIAVVIGLLFIYVGAFVFH